MNRNTNLSWLAFAAAAVVVGVVAVVMLMHRSSGASQPSALKSTEATTVTVASAAPPAGKVPQSPLLMTENVSPATNSDWFSLFASSHDYFAFVRSAAAAAFHGDGTAALYISKALHVCESVVVLYAGKPHPQEALQNWLASHPYLSEMEAAHFRRNFNLCSGFLHGSAFSMLPARRGGYLSYGYWLNKAYKEHNPVAEVFQAEMGLSGIGSTGATQSKAQVAQSQRLLAAAVSSGDPEAVFRAGIALLGRNEASPVRSFAVALAACDIGYDCSANNSSNNFLFGYCMQNGSCPPGEDLADLVRKSIGESGYAKAYALAEQLKYAISQGDTATVAQFVHLRQ